MGSFSIQVILFVLKTDITNLLLGAFIICNHILEESVFKMDLQDPFSHCWYGKIISVICESH